MIFTQKIFSKKAKITSPVSSFCHKKLPGGKTPGKKSMPH